MAAPVIVALSAIFCASSVICAAISKKAACHFQKTSCDSEEILPISKHTKVLYISSDAFNKHKVVNVLDGNRCRIYSIEKHKKFSCMWSLISSHQRVVIGAIGVKKFKMWVEFYNKCDLALRVVKKQRHCASKYQYFKYHNKNCLFRWMRTSQYLEMVYPEACDNLGGGCVNGNGCTGNGCGPCECRERIAMAKKLCGTGIDYEIIYDDTKIDRELLIATAFVSILTQWHKCKSAIKAKKMHKLHSVKHCKTAASKKAWRKVNCGIATGENKVARKTEKLVATKNCAKSLVNGKIHKAFKFNSSLNNIACNTISTNKNKLKHLAESDCFRRNPLCPDQCEQADQWDPCQSWDPCDPTPCNKAKNTTRKHSKKRRSNSRSKSRSKRRGHVKSHRQSHKKHYRSICPPC